MSAPIHAEPHPLAGQSVEIATGHFAGCRFHVEDWWDRVAGISWMVANGNPACIEYAFRSGSDGDPINNEVVYGKIGGSGKLMHVRHLPELEAAK